MHQRIAPLSLAAVLLSAGTAAQAGLLGSSITLNYHYQATTTTDAITVGNGVEVTCPTGAFNLCARLTVLTQTVDIGDQSIVYRYVGAGAVFDNLPVNGFDFQGLNLGSAITGISLSTDIVGLDLSRLSFTVDSVQIDMHGLGLASPGQGFTVQLLTSPVPEPSSVALLAMALALALAAVRWRQRS